MKNDIAKVSFDELNHFVGVFHQMGRPSAEWDFNEQNELMLRMLQRFAGDTVHTGSPNDGFRIDTHVVLDRFESRKDWATLPSGTSASFIDYFDHRVGDGSLVVTGATAVGRKLPRPMDLSRVREVLVAVKSVPAATLVFQVTDGTTTHAFTMNEVAVDDGWRLVRGVPGAWPAGLAADRITGYGFSGLNAAARYSFDVLKADLPQHTPIVDPGATDRYAALPASAALTSDDDFRVWGGTSVRVAQATAVSYAFPAPVDASRARRLLVAVRRVPGAAPLSLMLRDDAVPAQTVTLAAGTTESAGGWDIVSYALPQAGVFNRAGITQLAWTALDATAVYHLGPVRLEADPARDLIIMGGDGTSAGAGRFHGDGLAATRESHGTYFTQADLPQADPAALAPVTNASTHRIDWAYLDLWERPVSYAERPELRDVALDGIDTCTRTQLVAQVRLLKGTEVPLADPAVPPEAAFAALPRIGQGVLTTKDKPAAALDPCTDPCEPVIAGPYLGEENRLFRVEIHRAGDIGPANAATTAWFKWSRDNAGVMCPLIEDAGSGATSALVEKPELFAIGDLVELSNDLVEFATGVYEDRINHAKHRRGELRKVVSVNLQTRRIGWEDPSVVDPFEATFHAPLPQPMRLAHHAKLTRWNAVAPCTAGDIVLADGVVIEFGGQALAAGDYWLFATRTLDRSVERLIEAPPRGVKHGYYPLAAIHRSRGAAPAPDVVFAEDLRPRFAALPSLDASRIAYDPGACVAEHGGHVPGWGDVGTVQEAIDALCRADLTGDLKLHNKLLHGMGVICGLKLRCSKDRRDVILGKGYALDCQGELMHVGGDEPVPLVAQAGAQGLLDASGNGKVNLWIEPGPGGVDIQIEPHVPQSFWDQVLEGTLLKDFYEDVVLALVNFVKAQFTPFPDTTLPLSDAHKRLVSLLNLLWQVINSANGPYMYVSKAEHDLLDQLHEDLQDLLASKTYCAMFDNLAVFPPYPYPVPNGMDTMFGMWLMHRKVKLDPTGRYAVTYGFGRKLQLFDVQARTAVSVTDFPGATNVNVEDIAFNATGTEIYAVGTIANPPNVDSVFATLSVVPAAAPGGAPTLTWSGSTVVCDIRFVALATHTAQPGALFAVGRSDTDATKRGLYRFNPVAIPLLPNPIVNFNATGLFAIDTNGVDAVFSEHNGGLQTGPFNILRRVHLGTLVTSNIPFVVAGDTLRNDLAAVNGIVYATGNTGSNSFLWRISLNPQGLLGSTGLGSLATYRLGVLPSHNVVTLCEAETYRLRLMDIGTGIVQASVRIPLQIMPLAVAVRRDDREMYALNLGSTLNAINIGELIASTPSFTNEPPVTLANYREQMLKAFTDLGSVLIQYLKDGWCDKFLVECPTCGPDDKVYLGTVDIQGGQVHSICNFSKRHYAKSFRTWGYWLSAIPILPIVKTLFAKFCCLKLVP